jgi:hypothetical protein
MNQTKRKKIEIIQDAVVIYKDGERESISAIDVSKRGVFTGHIISKDEYMEGGGIPKNNIRKIIGGKKRLVYKVNA